MNIIHAIVSVVWDRMVCHCGHSFTFYLSKLPEISVFVLLIGLLILGINIFYPRIPKPLPIQFSPNTLAGRRFGLLSLLLASIVPLLVLAAHERRGVGLCEVAAAAGCLAISLTLGAISVVRAHRTRAQIANSHGTLRGKELAGAGLITGYAAIFLCVFFVVVSGANYTPYCAVGVCCNNLRQLDGAKEQWALENRQTATATPTMNDLVGVTKYIKVLPTCPENGAYILGNMSTKPRCSVAGHRL